MQTAVRPRSAAHAVAGYLTAIAGTAALILLQEALAGLSTGNALAVLYVLPAVAAAYVGGFGPGLLATVLAAIACDWFQTAPTHSLRIQNAGDLVTLAGQR